MSSLKIVAEYAKSNRSACKKCFKPINKDSLRLGLVSRDARGFDMTKWHHLDCFPVAANAISSVESVTGFGSLKSTDQEALRKLVESDKSADKVGADASKDSSEGKADSSKKKRVHERDEGNKEERITKEAKLSTHREEEKLDIVLSASDVKDKYKEATLLPNWKSFQTVIFLEWVDGLHDSTKIAAFDFDGCLAKTSVKRVGADAWSLMYPSIPEKLKSLSSDGYKLVIFTNESNIERWKNKRQVAVDSKIGRINNFIKEVKVPIQVFIACGLGNAAGGAEDPFRKPKTGMWQIMERHFNSCVAVDLNQSFYVGDAAGRPADHSDADIRFAETWAVAIHVFLRKTSVDAGHWIKILRSRGFLLYMKIFTILCLRFN